MRCVLVELSRNILFAHRVNVEVGADLVQFEIHPLTTVPTRCSLVVASIAVIVIIAVIRTLFGVFVECAGLHDSECFVRCLRTHSRVPHLRAVTAVHERGVTEQHIAWPR